MSPKLALNLIKEHLETKGVQFADYYGSWVYSSGPFPSEFFTARRDENYTVQVLTIPSEYIQSLMTEETLSAYLKKK